MTILWGERFRMRAGQDAGLSFYSYLVLVTMSACSFPDRLATKVLQQVSMQLKTGVTEAVLA